jgi:hypothetical protein
MQKRGLICFGLALLLVVVAAISIDLDGANVLALIMLAAAGLLFLIGFFLVGVGPRADKQGKQAKP